ncbi:hypothetical protein NAPIS_ORF02057 [Vairimorpha apis BRL 01]|nr:hypothetical protein NAPIS_ORF02057 [Vairimorpha apis BRL 01]
MKNSSNGSSVKSGSSQSGPISNLETSGGGGSKNGSSAKSGSSQSGPISNLGTSGGGSSKNGSSAKIRIFTKWSNLKFRN